eukprot:CAMPEP_0177627202 /NCGR_PEP_ID=MMETSP0419_2-20121207/31074_1 /TAXON_ID=582737 /ORGANISM="Tetraselmis sp., Strain GSL018" /LENGTH=487 /DNA_ID=CAMNT_0019128333 /DNA_START=1440 /DNA_END=2900 /DNA_ORIENTATION=-
MHPQQGALPSGNRELLKWFKVLRFLGKGSYGSVYKVKRISDEKVYAVKETDVKAMSQTERQEAVNEIRLLASVSHPNIVEYNEAFLDGNKLCIVMEYATAGDLAGLIKKQKHSRKPFDELQVWKYFIQIARGISALHEMRVLHRDIKPGNIFVGDDEVLKIGDLGIAKLLKGSMAKTQIGTPHYMPPEVWKSRPYAFPSDVWALGCILYELATFTVPFEARSMSELRYKILRGRFAPVSRHYSSDVSRMIDRLLQGNPESRPTVAQILDMDITKKMEQKIRLEAVPSAPSQMLDTIQVPRNLHLLKNKFPEPKYAESGPNKENEAPPRPGGPLHPIKENDAPRQQKHAQGALPSRGASRGDGQGRAAGQRPRPSAPERQPSNRQAYELDGLRHRVAPAPRPQYYGAPPAERAHAAQAGGARPVAYGQPAPYPPAYLARQGAAPHLQYPFHQPFPPYRCSPMYNPAHNYGFAQPVHQREHRLYPVGEW